MSFSALQKMSKVNLEALAARSGSNPSDESKKISESCKSFSASSGSNQQKFIHFTSNRGQGSENVEEEKSFEPRIKNIHMIHQFEVEQPDKPQENRFNRIETLKQQAQEKHKKSYFDRQRRELKHVEETEERIKGLSGISSTGREQRLSH